MQDFGEMLGTTYSAVRSQAMLCCCTDEITASFSTALQAADHDVRKVWYVLLDRAGFAPDERDSCVEGSSSLRGLLRSAARRAA